MGTVDIPVLKQGNFLIVSVQGALTDQDLLSLRDKLGRLIGQFRSKGVIIDVAALDVLDSFAARTLRSIAHITRLRGAEIVVVGIQPDVAYAMVQLGLTLQGVSTAIDLEEGLLKLHQKTGLSERVWKKNPA